MAYFICEKQGRCCPHEFYDSIEQAITDSEDGVPCDHLIEVAPVRHGRWEERDDGFGGTYYHCSVCGEDWCTIDGTPAENGMRYCPQCGARMDGDADG